MAYGRRNPGRQKHSEPAGSFGALLRNSLFLAGVIGVLCLAYFVITTWIQLGGLPDVASLEKYEPIEAIQIFDASDHLVCTVEGDEDRRVVPLNQISSQMQQAMLAAEDHHFFEHHGINLTSISRAFFVNMFAGHVVEGGSTITQQLVKNLFFTEAQRNMQRKFKEAILAYELESRYSKEKILELYLNQVYFGNGAYGIERAASRYFNRTAATLSLAQSAFIAGLVKAPSELGLPANRNIAIARQREILSKMVEYGYITQKQADNAYNEKLEFKTSTNPLERYPYYVSYVLQILRERFSESEMRRQGLRVYTCLDPLAQDAAEQVLNESVKSAPKGVTQGALVSMSVSDGSVVALVGGVGDFWKYQFNRATNPHTAGSSFKPFVYLTGLLKGMITPDSMVQDAPISISQGWGLPMWTPKNFDHKYFGNIPVKKALALSRNVCSVRIAQMVGINNVVETARLAGITTKLDPNLSLALGSSAVTPLDMASAYGTFARGGVAMKPRVIRKIEDNRGQVVETFEPVPEKVFMPDPVAELIGMMEGVVNFGTGTLAKLPDRPVAGKTGTADESKDIWFVGFTPDLVTALWAGNDENKPIPGSYVTGGSIMAKIWKKYNVAYYAQHPTPPGAFITPSVVPAQVVAPETTTTTGTDQTGVQLPDGQTPQTTTGTTTDSGQQPHLLPEQPQTELTPADNGNSMPPVAPHLMPAPDNGNKLPPPAPAINKAPQPSRSTQPELRPAITPSPAPRQPAASPNVLMQMPDDAPANTSRRLYPAQSNSSRLYPANAASQ